LAITARNRPQSRIHAPAESRPSGGTRIDRLVQEHFASLWRLARRWGLSAADAEDVAQRTLVITHQKLAEIEEGCERGFLFRTALFLASKLHRTRRRKPETALSDEAEDELRDPRLDPEQQLELQRERRRLDAILSSMPEDLRAVFVLFELERLTQPEIAEALTIPVGTVASRLRRAREAFVTLLRRANTQRITKEALR